jgi:hypothetical protein
MRLEAARQGSIDSGPKAAVGPEKPKKTSMLRGPLPVLEEAELDPPTLVLGVLEDPHPARTSSPTAARTIPLRWGSRTPRRDFELMIASSFCLPNSDGAGDCFAPST